MGILNLISNIILKLHLSMKFNTQQWMQMPMILSQKMNLNIMIKNIKLKDLDMIEKWDLKEVKYLEDKNKE